VGKPYAEMFGVGDTVGCLVNFRLNHALFTKNGRELRTLSPESACRFFSCVLYVYLFLSIFLDTLSVSRLPRMRC
jgi:hypothetical protein